jgi:hypothetical protein
MATNLRVLYSVASVSTASWLFACGVAADGALADESAGRVALALTAPNESARCVQERVTNLANGREQRLAFALTPGVEQTLELEGVPAGDVELAAFVSDALDGDRCVGNVLYEAQTQQLRLEPGQVAYVSQRFLSRSEVVIDGSFETDIFETACALQNVALGADASRSAPGWGGGTAYSDLSDGLTRYGDTWAHGLAFTGGPSSWAGELCGSRQLTLDLGSARTFQSARMYHHGDYHIPMTDSLEYSADGESWQAIDQTRSVRFDLRTDMEADYYGATPTEHVFAPVTARFVRYSFDNCEMLQPTLDSHGWLYEAEIYGCSDE